MAMLLFKGETLKVRVTHNVISELIRLNKSSYQEVISLSSTDPFGWVRDVVYCSLRVYKPDVLGEMTPYEVGDEVFKMSPDKINTFLSELFEDFVQNTGLKKVASKKK